VKRRWKRITIIALLVSAAIPVALHYRAKSRLSEYREQLKRSGEKIDINELIPPTIPNGFANGAKFLSAEAAISPRLRELSPLPMKIVAPGKARVAWRESEDIQVVDSRIVPEMTNNAETNVWPLFEAEFITNEPQLKILRETTKEPLQFPINYSQGSLALLPHLALVKAGAIKLGTGVSANLRRTNTDEAIQYLLSQANLIQSWQHEPTAISQLVRVGCVIVACGSAWETLQAEQLTDNQLRTVQEAFERINTFPDAAWSMRFEMASANQIVDLAREDINVLGSGPSTNRLGEFGEMFGQVLSDPGVNFQQFMNRYPRYWAWCWIGSYHDQRTMLIHGIEAARRLEAAQGGLSLPTQIGADSDPEPDSGSMSVLGFSLWSTLAPSSKKFIRAQSELSLLVTAIALKRYHLRHGVYPKTIKELTPDVLKTVPIDYQDGQPVRYRVNTNGTYLLYSIGDDGHDDGGDATPPTPTLADVPKLFYGKDLVWPLAASPEEVRAFEEKTRKKKY
jgi:hypothetical protein